jgi:hypothetical protein
MPVLSQHFGDVCSSPINAIGTAVLTRGKRNADSLSPIADALAMDGMFEATEPQALKLDDGGKAPAVLVDQPSQLRFDLDVNPFPGRTPALNNRTRFLLKSAASTHEEMVVQQAPFNTDFVNSFRKPVGSSNMLQAGESERCLLYMGQNRVLC